MRGVHVFFERVDADAHDAAPPVVCVPDVPVCGESIDLVEGDERVRYTVCCRRWSVDYDAHKGNGLVVTLTLAGREVLGDD